MQLVNKKETGVYISTKITIGKTVWGVLKSYKYNRVSICKLTNNPFKSLGKDFSNFDEAISNYNNKNMKQELRNVENAMALMISLA